MLKKFYSLIDFIPNLVYYSKCRSGDVAQLVRAPACHAGGREFESLHSRHSC